MLANAYRGEIIADLGGRRRRLRLTLGALAELETAFGASGLGDLAARFADGNLKAREAILLIGAALRGAGEAISDEDVASLEADGGALAYAAIVADLLKVTFSLEARAPANPPAP